MEAEALAEKVRIAAESEAKAADPAQQIAALSPEVATIANRMQQGQDWANAELDEEIISTEHAFVSTQAVTVDNISFVSSLQPSPGYLHTASCT